MTIPYGHNYYYHATLVNSKNDNIIIMTSYAILCDSVHVSHHAFVMIRYVCKA